MNEHGVCLSATTRIVAVRAETASLEEDVWRLFEHAWRVENEIWRRWQFRGSTGLSPYSAVRESR